MGLPPPRVGGHRHHRGLLARVVIREPLYNVLRQPSPPSRVYRGTSLVTNTPPAGPYGNSMPRVLWWSWGGWRFLKSEAPLCMYVGMRRRIASRAGRAESAKPAPEGCAHTRYRPYSMRRSHNFEQSVCVTLNLTSTEKQSVCVTLNSTSTKKQSVCDVK